MLFRLLAWHLPITPHNVRRVAAAGKALPGLEWDRGPGTISRRRHAVARKLANEHIWEARIRRIRLVAVGVTFALGVLPIVDRK